MESPFDEKQIVELDKPLDPRFISDRKGASNRKLRFLEGHDAIDQARVLIHVTDDCQCKGVKCRTCHALNCVDNMRPKKKAIEGKHAKCRDCYSAYNKEHYRKNKKKYSASNKKSRQKDRAKYLEGRQKYYQEHKEEYQEYRQENLESIKEYYRNWRQDNAEARNAIENARRAMRAGNGGSYAQEEWQALKEYYGNTCLRCGDSNIKLTADHIIPISKGGTSYIDNIQPLCHQCNSIKGTACTDYRRN